LAEGLAEADEGNNTLSMQVSVQSRNCDEGSEDTGRKFIQSKLLSRNSDEKSKLRWYRVDI